MFGWLKPDLELSFKRKGSSDDDILFLEKPNFTVVALTRGIYHPRSQRSITHQGTTYSPRDAASIFNSLFLERAAISRKTLDLEILAHCFDVGHHGVLQLNDHLPSVYPHRDRKVHPYHCISAAAVVTNGHLHMGCMPGTEFRVYDPAGNPKPLTGEAHITTRYGDSPDYLLFLARMLVTKGDQVMLYCSHAEETCRAIAQGQRCFFYLGDDVSIVAKTLD